MAKKCKKTNRTNIGGQAVLEGVMMRGATSMATAVRDEDGIIRLETKRHSTKKKNIFFRLPIIRGAINFFVSMVSGVKTLMRSAEVFGGDEPTKFDKWLAKKFHIDIMTLVIYLGVFLGLFMSVLLFVLSPQWIGGLIIKYTPIQSYSIAFNFIEGVIRILIFVGYILLTSLAKDIKRTYKYHGAEHKTISCFESGKELTVENVRGCSRVHDRCGTTFMFFVMLVSILVFSLANSLPFMRLEKGIVRALVKIALLPLVAGLSYELLKGLAKTDCFIFYPIKLPGLMLQHITTAEPDDDMIEVAIVAFNTVLEMEKDQSIQPQDFITSMKICDLHAKIDKQLKEAGITEDSDAEWITSICCDIPRSEISENRKYVAPKIVEKALKIADERAKRRPLWYIVGDTEFYGKKIKVDERVLIPRPETEELVFNALKYINNESKVLDLCTGSGAIAISVKAEKGCLVDASDVSSDALALARENAEANQTEINFIESNLFDNISSSYDVILTNPPYIKSADVENLEKEVTFEPKLALDGGNDGLDFYRKIAVEAKRHLNVNGVIFLECGFDQAKEVAELFNDYKKVETIKDLNGIDRIVKAEL